MGTSNFLNSLSQNNESVEMTNAEKEHAKAEIKKGLDTAQIQLEETEEMKTDSQGVGASVTRLKRVTEQTFLQKMKEGMSFEQVREGKMLLVDHPLFESTICCLILLNLLVLGVEADSDLGYVGVALANFFTTAWTLEALCKIYSYGPKGYFCSWSNLFDFVLALLAITDTWLIPLIAGDNFNTDTLAIVRILRITRIVRLVRIIKMFTELWLLCMGLVNSVAALGWTLVLMSVLIYGFAIVLTLTVGKECTSAVFIDWTNCEAYYGNLPRSMYTLFEIMTLDLSGLRPVVTSSPATILLMMVFITVAAFGLMNIIMGVIVEKVLESSNANEEKLQKERLEKQKMELELLGELFEEADLDGSGKVSLDEFLDACERDDVQALFADVGMPVSRRRLATRLFEVLDADSRGEMDVKTFVSRCFDLKADGKVLTQDMTTLVVDVRHTARRVSRIEADTAKILRSLNVLMEHLNLDTAGLQKQDSEDWSL